MLELHFPTPALADETVLLRPWREADVPGNLMAFGDPVIQKFSWPSAEPFTEQDACGYFADQQSARLRGQEFSLLSLSPTMRKRCLVVPPCTHWIVNGSVPLSGTGSSPRLVAEGLPPTRSGYSRGGESRRWGWLGSS